MRDFVADFCRPAIDGLDAKDAARVGLALDAAIAFGVLEYVDGNPSLQHIASVQAKYIDNVLRLKALRSAGSP